MNKKISTFLVSMLLAGGMFSANGQTKVWPTDVADNGYYHVLKVSTGTVSYNSHSVSVSKDGKTLQKETTRDAVTKANAWKISAFKVNGTEIGYVFTNANGIKLQFDENGAFTSDASKAFYEVFKFDGTETNGGKILKAVDGKGKFVPDMYLLQSGNGYTLGKNGTTAAMFTLPIYEVTEEDLTVKQLEDGFAITIGKTKGDKDNAPEKLIWDGAYDELEGNEFTGKLIPEKQTDGTFMLKNENEKYIVLTSDKWGDLSNSLQGIKLSGYKFTTMTKAQIAASKKILGTSFTITQPNAITAEPLEIKTADADGNEYELMVAGVAGTYYLTTGNAADNVNDPNLKPAGTESQLVGTASFTNNWTEASGTTENTYVKFGMDNLADYTLFNDVVWNIQRDEIENDKVKETLVAGPETKDKDTWTPAAQVAFAYPEGQWLWNGEEFVNRESASELTLAGLREVEDEDYTAGNDTYVFTTGNHRYTFTKAGEPGENITLGYLNETNDDLLQNAFYVGTPIKATGDTVYIAKDEDNVLYLSEDKDEAVAFRLKKEIQKSKDKKDSELILHVTPYASSKTKDGVARDILHLYKYLLTDASTGEKLYYNETIEKYVLTDEDVDVDALVLKNKDVNLYNLVQDLDTPTDSTNNSGFVGKKFTNDFTKAKKLYGAHNTAELQQADEAYALIANDLFVLTPVEAGQHVSDIEGDTIKIFREAENNFYLYAGKDNFLELTSFVDPTDNGGAFYVDSAAGKGTWRQEYLLALDPEFVPAGKYCPICGESDCAHAEATMGFTEGLYLVNLVDSAKVAEKAGVKDKDNKFKFQNYGGAPYYRLGFVPARHVEDSLIIASTSDTIIVSSNNFADAKVCDFAFHYVADDAFIIETAYDYTETVDPLTEEVTYTATEGYIKYHNGVPVVTPKREEAEVFLFEETTEKPTDNEEISTSEVKVIAGNGQITIAGAAGKKVVVSNILGQVVANTVITSDNATIAAPQGIVVVAVEGEEAVKAIVK